MFNPLSLLRVLHISNLVHNRVINDKNMVRSRVLDIYIIWPTPGDKVVDYCKYCMFVYSYY